MYQEAYFVRFSLFTFWLRGKKVLECWKMRFVFDICRWVSKWNPESSATEGVGLALEWALGGHSGLLLGASERGPRRSEL